MGRAVLIALALALLAGCPSRIPAYAPRMGDTPEHRDAVKEDACGDCHDPARLRGHGPRDACTSCHTICRGC